MHIEFIKNPETGIIEAWEDGQVIGEFIATGMLAKGWRMSDCLIRKEQRLRPESGRAGRTRGQTTYAP
ncbi:MAG: hypothetical protein K6G42_10920 [Lachnospiraceae bacterium]|nr:hypothetical protein [Lachnospiraceae bacterium]